MKKMFPHDAHPTKSQEERRSLLPFFRRAICALRRYSLGILLAFLILSLPHACAQPFTERNPAKDITTSGLGLSNKNARGIWVDEEKQVMLVLDAHGQNKKIFSYCMETKRRLDSHHNDGEVTRNPDTDDFYLYSTGTTQLPKPYGIWANGTTNGSTLWVSNFDDGKIYAYNLSWHQSPVDSTKKYAKGTRNSDEDVSLHSQNKKPHGIWVHDDILWVADNGADKIFAYNWPSKTRNSSKDITLTHKDAYAQGIWSNGKTLWVANIAGSDPDDEQIIYAYDITSKARDPRKDFTALSGAGNDRPRGIWSDGTTMYVADQTDNKIYAYNFTDHPNSALDFDTLQNAGNRKPKGMWSDGETMWVADATNRKLYAYDFFTKERLADKDFDTLNAENTDPTGIWSNGETMWVADWNDNKIYAYKMSDKTHDEGKDFNTLDVTTGANDDESEDPIGIWSDGTTMWVADIADDKVYAYKMSDKSRDSTKDINFQNLLGNPYPQGIWSDGTTMWVADFIGTRSNIGTHSKIYAFTLPVDVEDENGVKSVTAASRVEAKDLKVLALENKKARGIWSDKTTMWVTDDDPGNSKIYAYRLSDAASLGSLGLTGHVPNNQYENSGANSEVQLNLEFNSGITRYTANVPYATSQLTVSSETLRPADKDGVSYSPADADTTTAGHQVNLTVGDNPISITVTNGQTTGLPRTRTYTVNVKRGFFTHNDPSKDIELSFTDGIQGIWANETNLWVAVDNSETNKLHAYKKADGSRDSSKDIGLISTNSTPRGIWANETTMWVTDKSSILETYGTDSDGRSITNTHKRIFAYNMWTNSPTTGERMFDGSHDESDPTKDFKLNPSNSHPQWIWSDGETMWVTDDGGTGDDSKDDKIFAYNLADKTHDPSRDISLAHRSGNNASPTGICSDGANLWIANSGTNNAKIYSYKLAANSIDCREEGKDFDTLKAVGNHNPEAIYTDGTTMYVADSADGKIYAYNQPLSGNAWLKTLTLSGGVFYGTQPFQHSNPTTHYNTWVDSATATTTINVAPQDTNANTEIVFINNLGSESAVVNGGRITLGAGNNEIEITVTAEDGDVKLYTANIYRTGSNKRINPLDFKLTEDNANPIGIWSDGETMWVVGRYDKTVYAYKTSGEEWGEPDDERSFKFALEQTQGFGIWGTKTNIWVSNDKESGLGANKLFAYKTFSDEPLKADERRTANVFGIPDPSKDFNSLKPEALLPNGLFGDGETLWVVGFDLGDNPKGKLFAYNRTNKTRDSAKDVSFSDTPWLVDIWANESTIWVVNNSDETQLQAYKRSGADAKDANGKHVRDSGKDISLSTDNGKPRGIWSNGTVMWVSDEDDGKIYAYRMPTTSPPTTTPGVDGNSDFFFSEDSTLKDLQLSGATLTPAFSADNLYYTALVDSTVSTATVTATSNDSMAAVDIFSGGRGTTRSTAKKGPQVSLEEGYNIIAIDVTAESRTAQSTYLIRVTKAEAPPTSGGPLPAFQTASTSDNPSASSSSSVGGLGEWKSRLMAAASLPNGGVRFVFLVPAGEFQIEETPDLWRETWRPLPEEDVKILRESNGNGPDRLTIILPKAAGNQRFLRLTPRK